MEIIKPPLFMEYCFSLFPFGANWEKSYNNPAALVHTKHCSTLSENNQSPLLTYSASSSWSTKFTLLQHL